MEGDRDIWNILGIGMAYTHPVVYIHTQLQGYSNRQKKGTALNEAHMCFNINKAYKIYSLELNQQYSTGVKQGLVPCSTDFRMSFIFYSMKKVLFLERSHWSNKFNLQYFLF